jgi:cyclopropane-fatty-acyl-phospholipid synthase
MTVSVAIRWPSIACPPKAPLAATFARLIFERAVHRIPVRVSYPDGAVTGGCSAESLISPRPRDHPGSPFLDHPGSPCFEIVRPRSFFARLGRDTKIGFGEAYMAGDWRAGPGTDLADLLTPFAARLTRLVPEPLQRLRALVDRRVPASQENTPQGSRDNISAHYDLSNDLFEAFLDPTMSYSSAWFDENRPATGAATTTTLEEAQLRKIDGVLDYAGVRAGTRLLEIGTGWGALAIRAAQRGATVTTVTISAEQLTFAAKRVAEAGLSERVDLRLQDYREVEGEFDAIVSVEMIEAVGEAYWPTYFATIDRLLAPGGKVSIQAITMAHERVLATRRSFSWIQKYIFPGGIIPSLQSIDETLAAHTTLRVTQRRELGGHYARTLRLWRERFTEEWPRIHQLGFDETFRRMWEFYLAYCEAGFRTGYLGVSQLQMTREPVWS